MIKKTFRTVSDIVKWRLCIGCGACQYICPDKVIQLKNIYSYGIRPILTSFDCGECKECLKVCPVYNNNNTDEYNKKEVIKELIPYYGPVKEIWEGYASDPETRYKGSSGGIISALLIYCIEKKIVSGALHVGQNPKNPFENISSVSKTRVDVLEKCGSRYSPASVCDKLKIIDNEDGKYVFVGKPSDIIALRKIQNIRSGIKERISCSISFFCAGTPSSEGTAQLCKSLNVNPKNVSKIRYRGYGWPGEFTVMEKRSEVQACRITYKKAWNFLRSYRPYSAHLWPDGSGELADISCGDAWHRSTDEKTNGHSLILLRTEIGQNIFQGAIKAGYIIAESCDYRNVIHAQKKLNIKRGEIWGRMMAFKAFGLPIPKVNKIPLFRLWLQLSLVHKIGSIFGTIRRIITRKYYKPDVS